MINWKKDEKLLKFQETNESTAWVQRLGKERRNTLRTTAEKILELEHLMKEKNEYMHHFKNERAASMWGSPKCHTGRTSKAFGFDKVNEMDTLPEENTDNAENFCQKCKYESKWCKHRKIRDTPKDMQSTILTTNQGFGWRPSDYDTFEFNNKRVGHCKRTFHDAGHL